MKTNHREAQTREDQITLKGTINPQTKPTSLVFPATKSLPSFSCMALKSRCLSRRGNRFIWSPWSAGVPSSCSPPPNWIIASMFCQAGAQPTPQPHSQPNPQPWSYPPPSHHLTISILPTSLFSTCATLPYCDRRHNLHGCQDFIWKSSDHDYDPCHEYSLNILIQALSYLHCTTRRFIFSSCSNIIWLYWEVTLCLVLPPPPFVAACCSPQTSPTKSFTLWPI